jgi:hypothetical protein
MTSPRSLRFAALFAILGAAVFSGGCNHNTYEVKVDSMAKRDSVGKVSDAQSYSIRSKNPAMGDESLRYREAADYVKTALSGKGLFEAPNTDAADMIVELDYGVDAPRTKIQNVSVPRYTQIGGGVRYEQVPVTDARGNTSLRTVAVFQSPRTEFVGYEEMPQRVTVYEKYLRITARENKPSSEGRPAAQIWSVQTSTEDESKDLRKYLPIMASATADYIGKDSSSPKVVKVKDPSPVVDFIRRGPDGSNQAAAQPPTERPKI